MSLARWLTCTCFAVALIAAAPAAGVDLHHMAENNQTVAIIEVVRTADYTEVRLETQAPQSNVCWWFLGPDSPYLRAAEHRYRFLSGEAIYDCPNGRDYAAHKFMVLRFEPLPPEVCEFSLIEGKGGENQITAGPQGIIYWNFLNVKLNDPLSACSPDGRSSFFRSRRFT
jgi:hypothetical protein